MAAASSRPKLLVIVGPTASGKSDLALKIAKNYGGEVISADSWAVYKGFDIGTGKPTAAQQKAVRHHLISVREPADGFNAPKFKEMAEQAISDIQKRGKLPILAGGTGLYVDSVLYNFGFLPNSSPDEREKLNQMSLIDLIKMAKSLKLDPSGIDTRNKRRVIRAIEARGQQPTKQKLRSGTMVIGLRPPNEVQRRQVEMRVDKMLAGGLQQEVKSLTAKFGWGIEPMKGIGYREWREFFAGSQTLEQTRQRIISSTINLAKRQRTWFRRSQDIQWFSSATEAYDYISSVLNTNC